MIRVQDCRTGAGRRNGQPGHPCRRTRSRPALRPAVRCPQRPVARRAHGGRARRQDRRSAGRPRRRRRRAEPSICPATPARPAGPTCTCTWVQQSSPQSYAEGFRLDDIDFAFRSVGYAKKTLLAGFTSVRDLGGEVAPHLRDAINQGLVDGPRIWAAGKSIATTGGHADPTNGYNAALSHLIGPPGPTEGVVNSVDDARQAVRQRYKEGSDVIKITATGGVLSLRQVRRRAAVHRRRGQGDRRYRQGLRLPRRRARARRRRHQARGARRRHHRSSTAPT